MGGITNRTARTNAAPARPPRRARVCAGYAFAAATSRAVDLTIAPDLYHQDAGNARQQAARGTYDPGYLNYTLGKLMIRKLRDDWTGTRGGKQSWKLFNDEFLSYGGPPIPLVRSQMMPGPAGGLF